MLYYLSVFLISLGAFLMITTVVGVIRFPDFYTRLHAAGVGDSLGMALILIGSAIQQGDIVFFLKVLILIVISWITGTTSCHALANSVYKTDYKDKG